MKKEAINQNFLVHFMVGLLTIKALWSVILKASSLEKLINLAMD